MKVCIYGAGAIGLLVGARLAATGSHQVSAVARGATLAALVEHGLRVDGFAGPLSGPVTASAEPSALGFAITQTPEERHAITRKLGAFKTSMLQDAEAGRAIELDSLVGAVRELGRHVGVETPLIDAIYGLARVFGQVHGLYPQP